MRTRSTAFVLFATLTLAFSAQFSAQAESIRDLANDFIDAHDKQIASRNEVSTDRDTMKANLDDTDKLRDAVKEFFNDRADVEKFATQKADVRDELFDEANTVLPPVQKPPKSNKNLLEDTQRFITAFDLWRAKDAEVQQRIEGIRQGLAGDDAALRVAVDAFFVSRRERRIQRDLWTAALKAMKADIKFRSTLKPTKFDADSLKGYTQEYLNDRDQWVALGMEVDVDYNALRAAISAGTTDLTGLVTEYFNDKKARNVKAQEMAKDRASMQKNNPIKSAKSAFKNLFTKTNNAKVDEEEETLEQTTDHAGV